MADQRPDERPRPVELRLPARTVITAFLAVLGAVVAVLLWPLFLQVLLALLIAVSLHPLVRWLERRGLPHAAAVTLIAIALLVVIGSFVVLAVPPIAVQGEALLKSLPDLRDRMLHRLSSGGMLHDLIEKMADQDNLPDPGKLLKHAMTVGAIALGGIAELGIVLTIAVYLLFDGDRVWRWLLPYFPPRHRGKLHQTAGEVAEVIYAYVVGNLITSVVCSIFSYVVLLLLHVPAALILALAAGIFDILPIIGFFISIVPAALLALTVSPSTAAIVVVAYIAYNLFENYVLVPMVYGSRMRLSTLTVLLALFVGALLAGIPGAIAVLPVVASYPIVERIWLARWLGREVVEEHAAEGTRG